jgi:hypothetical protein
VIAGFASRGPSCYGHDPFTKPNISAPGVNLQLPIPTDDWANYSGTSFSNSYGAGGMVLLLSCSPDLIGLPYDLMAALQNAADTPPNGNCGAPPDGQGNYTYGYGYMNLLAAGLQNCDDVGVLEDICKCLTGEPLDASVTVNLTESYSWLTDPNGYYSMTLVVGDYQVTAALSVILSDAACHDRDSETTIWTLH